MKKTVFQFQAFFVPLGQRPSRTHTQECDDIAGARRSLTEFIDNNAAGAREKEWVSPEHVILTFPNGDKYDLLLKAKTVVV